MDIMYFIQDVLAKIGRFFKRSVNQSLILICLTAFLLGAQLAIWTGDQPGTWIAAAYFVLLILYLFKNMSILLKEIKEVPANGTQDLSPTNE